MKNLVEFVIESIVNKSPPWRSVYNRGMPTNPQTGKRFTGINPLILDAVADKEKYRSKFWCTSKQWKLLDLRTEGIGTKIINWRSETIGVDKGTFLSIEKTRFLKTFSVFNADQCFGKTTGQYLILKENNQEPNYEKAEIIIKETGARIVHHARAIKPRYERVPKDYILLPLRSRFLNDAQYWSTVFHELAHYSELRIGWNNPLDQGELFAEIVSGYLESELNLPHDQDMTNYEKWFKIWIDKIEKNPNYLLQSAAYAARSLNWILSHAN